MKKSLLILGIISLSSNSVLSRTEQKDSKYGIETDILWPILVKAKRTHLTAKLWQRKQLRGDVYVGLNIDFPRLRDTEGRFADYRLASGYRQYFWKGLHAEFSQTTGIGVLQNHVKTGKTYKSFDWLITGYVGYKFEFVHKKFYVLPQFGVAGVIYKSNPWPIYQDNTLSKEVAESPFLLGSLRLGYNF